MALYVYKAVDSQGKTIKGEMEAASEMDLSTQLAQVGYLPISISFKSDKNAVVKKKTAAVPFLAPVQKVSPQALIIFTRQFSSVIKAAVPLLEGLRILAEQAEDPTLKKALQAISQDIESGSSLSAAMAKHPGVFSDLYVNTVVAGESAGVLEKVLMKLSLMLEEEFETVTNIQSAMRYPIMVMLSLVSAVVVMSVFVMPQFTKMYQAANVPLPLPTQVLLFISNTLRFRWYILIPSLAGIIIGFQALIRSRPGRLWWDGLKFKTPIVGKIYTKMTMLRFCSMLSILYQAGLPVLRTLDIVGLTIGNTVLSKEIDAIKKDVTDGKGISSSVLNSKLFPRLVGFMISIGEKSGSLPMMLDSLYEYFHLEVRAAIKNLTTMIEPLMTSVLGLVVVGMALAIFLPLWNMIEIFKNAGTG